MKLEYKISNKRWIHCQQTSTTKYMKERKMKSERNLYLLKGNEERQNGESVSKDNVNFD